jgi:bifunctional oligoribonuclease and PAP phosphatase NrnA
MSADPDANISDTPVPDIPYLLELLSSDKKKVIIFHKNGDPDALGSAIALAGVFPGMSISITGGLNLASKNLAIHFDLENVMGYREYTAIELEQFELAIIIDTSTPSLVEIVPSIPKLVIDHHAENAGWQGREDVLIYHSCPEKRSCAEIIYSLLVESGREIPQTAITCLIAGILTDTGHMTFSESITLRTMADILDRSSVTIEEIHNALNSRNENYSKRIAKLKAAQRVKVEEFRKVLITTSEVNAFEGDAARAMLSLGGDVAFIGSTRKNDYRISARANPSLVRRGFHLGTFLEGVGAEVNAEGGGHPGAAGLNGTGDVEAVLHICRERMKKVIRKLPEPESK